MKAPKNFYNTVDQSKLGIDDLFTRTAENEADITALETVVGNYENGLVADVNQLKADSEHYHDDIQDLKSEDIGLGMRIDDVKEDVDKIVNGTVVGTISSYPAFTQIEFSHTIDRLFISLYEAGANAVVIARNTNSSGFSNEVIFRPVSVGGPGDDSYHYITFVAVKYSTSATKVVEHEFMLSSLDDTNTVSVTTRNLT